MGVMGCHRHDCENVMCDRYSEQFGYLCEDCFEELVALGVDTDLDKFMTREIQRPNLAEATRAYFNEVFPARGE